MTQRERIDTARVANRRQLRFISVEDALAEVDRLVAADAGGTLKRLGNWTVGQALGHLATWAEFAYTGSPLSPPWFVRILSRMMKRRFIYGSLDPGFNIPKVPGGTLGTEPISTEAGLSRYEAVMKRLEREAPSLPNAIFGPLSHEEWKQLHLRHAELHLSFLIPAPRGD